MYKSSQTWESNVPPDLIHAIEHLRDSFNYAHFQFGRATTFVCFSQLHDGAEKRECDNSKAYIESLVRLKSRISPAANKRFNELITHGTLPATFKGFFDFYLEGIQAEALRIFGELLEVGIANEQRIDLLPVKWAKLQMLDLIRSHQHKIRSWVRDVCDDQVFAATDDLDDRIYWKTWRAPLLVFMKPSWNRPFEAERVWQREDEAQSEAALKHFVERFSLVLDIAIKNAAGRAALELAKEPTPARAGTLSSNLDPKSAQTFSADIPKDDEPALKKNADRRSSLLRRLERDESGTLRTEEAAFLFETTPKTIGRCVNKKTLSPGAKRGTVTNNSIRRRLGKSRVPPPKSR